MDGTRHVRTIVIGGGQAGLSVGYHLKRRGEPFLILDAHDRVGDAWRGRWDSLRLFTPAKFDGLDGMPFPAPPNSFPTKDEMGDYLESYARRFELPVLTGKRVTRLSRDNGRFTIDADDRFEADNVVVAMANYQRPWVPPFAGDLDPRIVQLHSIDYRSPEQLQEGAVLLVGGGNTGSELAMELAPRHTVWMSGRDTGHLPFRIAGLAGRVLLVRLVLRFVFHRVLTVNTPMGRKARPRVVHKGGPLIRVMPEDLERAGVQRVPKTARIENGRPVLEDGRVLDVANVIWCTGFRPGFDWIDLPVIEGRDPLHRSGVVEKQPGLYFVGLHFLHAMSSVMIHGVGRDAHRIAAAIAARGATRSGPARKPAMTAA
jgi:putative flavoprotein involved in K+ transport